MAIFPLMGVIVVGLTKWKLRTKAAVAIVGTALWVAIVVAMLHNSQAGPALSLS